MLSNNYIYKAGVFRRFFLYKILNNYCHTIVLTNVIIKISRETKYFLFECIPFLKSKVFTERLSCDNLYASTNFREGINQLILNIQIDIVCDTEMNEHMHDMSPCSNISFITHWIY